MRYKTTRTKKDNSGKTVYTTTYYPSIPLSDDDVFITPKDGDRIDSLAHNYYGDISLWWIIAKANGIKGKVALPLGEVIRIPGNVQEIIENFNDLNRYG
tara:strand:+ start:296 stop:592 length:297 start_codon:yes stop_codon:yes gene_type:complete